jgi:FAD/FMN-containing dehydrogenase
MLTIIALLLMSARLSASTGTNLTECLQAAKLEFIPPSFANYTANSYTFNHRFLFSPVDIVFPTNAAGVAKAVECASNASVKIAARSGGHSYAANGAGGQNGSLVIDLKYLNSTTISATTAKFGTGIRLGNLALALNASGRAMAHGKFFHITVIY